MFVVSRIQSPSVISEFTKSSTTRADTFPETTNCYCEQLASTGERMVAVCHSTVGTKGFIEFDLFTAVGTLRVGPYL